MAQPAADREDQASPGSTSMRLIGSATAVDEDPMEEAVPRGGGFGWISPFRIGLAVLLVVAALLTWVLTGSAAPAYRTAVVGTGTVESTIDSVGTITPVNQAGLNFNASGTVSAVDVSVGQNVTSGQILASLDTATLNAAVTTAQASLASAQATLASAEASEAWAPSTSTTPSTTATTTASSTSAHPAEDSQQIATLQATLVAAQTQADTDSTTSGTALTAATSLCEVAAPAASTPAASTPASEATTPGSGTTPASEATTPGSGTTPPSDTTGSGAPTTCSTALSQASAAQARVAADLQKVAQAESALNAALGSPSASTAEVSDSTSGTGGSSTQTDATTTTTTPPASPSGASTGGGTTRTSTGSGSTSSASKAASPEQLAVDQASIDTAQANLNNARQAVGGANLISTIAGTVASVSVATGNSVTAGGSSTTPQIVVIGAGSSYQVTTAIPVTDIAKVAVGQPAEVTPDSTNSLERGRVSAIGVLATSGTSATTYPVTLSLTSTNLGQLSGSDANVAIVVKKSVGVMTVPSSAIDTVGSIHLVTVVDGQKATPTRVTVGILGGVLTQVTSGVKKGETVSLANLNKPLPSTSTTTTRSGFSGLGGGGSFSGVGLGGGSFAGGTGFGASRAGG